MMLVSMHSRRQMKKTVGRGQQGGKRGQSRVERTWDGENLHHDCEVESDCPAEERMGGGALRGGDGEMEGRDQIAMGSGRCHGGSDNFKETECLRVGSPIRREGSVGRLPRGPGARRRRWRTPPGQLPGRHARSN